MISNMPQGGLIVAVDGPSGTGKSTACRALAQHLGAKYLDTGAMYRVATLHVLRHGIDPQDSAAVIAATSELPLVVNDDPVATTVLLAGADVSADIRSAEVTRHVSTVSAIPEVRENLVDLQRSLIEQAGRCVVEGRDIGTVVLIDALLKVFLTASAAVRAQRRFDQDIAAGRSADYDSILADIERRDAHDSNRAASPLRPASDAILVDTSDLSLAEVIDHLVDLAVASAERTPEL